MSRLHNLSALDDASPSAWKLTSDLLAGMKGFSSHQELVEQYSYYLKAIKELDLAYCHSVEGRVAGIADQEAKEEESLEFLVSSAFSSASFG